MKPGRGKYFFAAAAFFLLALAGAQAQLPPGHAANFNSLAYFEPPNDAQVETRISAAEAVSLPEALVDLKETKVERFRTDGKLDAVVTAPQCVYSLQDGVANSAGHLELKSGDGKFHVEGDGFLWRRKEQTLTISNHVHTVIGAQLLLPNIK